MPDAWNIINKSYKYSLVMTNVKGALYIKLYILPSYDQCEVGN